MPTSAPELKASLEKHNATFESLLNLIPAKYYLVQDLSEEQVSSISKSQVMFATHRFETACVQVSEKQ
jgi:hypothetical protein